MVASREGRHVLSCVERGAKLHGHAEAAEFARPACEQAAREASTQPRAERPAESTSGGRLEAVIARIRARVSSN
eukprot:6202414-Lingulodinium_polyedra.AAC.1